MKTRKVAAMLPLLAGIGLGIAALAVPFLVANHYIMAEGKRYAADNLLFFFWGKYYTVAGANLIQSQIDVYDFGDFPIYAMAVIIIGLILAVVSMFGGRGVILNIKGRVLKLKLDTSPIWLQMFATILILLSYIYMNDATGILTTQLQMANYTVENGPSTDFLLGSIIALIISTTMTAVKFLKDTKDSKDSKMTNNGKMSQGN
jgi:hypothetical protein